MKKFASVAVAAGLMTLIFACRGTSGHFPPRHRATAEACPTTPRPKGYASGTVRDAGPSGGPSCESDVDCTAGKNGRCQIYGNGTPMCTYDKCMSDAECGGGKVCECGYQGNSCVTANCHTDADCNGLGCSPTLATQCGNMGGNVGYYCHTKHDDCVEDSDCKKGTDTGMCVYEPAASKWTCNYSRCVG